MRFHVISKTDGHYVDEADTLAELVSKGFTIEPFMVVASETVAEGEDFQAIQVHPDTVLINSKPGHRYVSATSITEAFGGSTTPEEDTFDDNDETKFTVTFTTDHGTKPADVELTEAGSIELPTFEAIEEGDFIYTFGGWKNGNKPVSSPLNVTKDMRLTAVWTKSEKPFVSKTYSFSSYAMDKTTKYADGTVETLEKPADGKQKVRVLTNVPEREDNPFIGRTLYVDVTGDDDGFHQLYDAGKQAIEVLVKIGG